MNRKMMLLAPVLLVAALAMSPLRAFGEEGGVEPQPVAPVVPRQGVAADVPPAEDAPATRQGMGDGVARRSDAQAEDVPDDVPTQLPLTSQAAPSVSYQAHVQNVGWQAWTQDGATAGTSGQSLRMEAMRLSLSGIGGGITYRSHVQGVGWQGWVSDGEPTGTDGQSLRMEAIEIKLTGAAAGSYDVYYRTHVQSVGWQDWKKNGELSGTSGQSLRMEAIEIRIIDKNSVVGASYQAHVQDVGWQSWVDDGAVAGTVGKALRVEALRVKLTDGASTISYRARVQGSGWQGWVSNGALAGTTGQAKHLEALEMNLSGAAASAYDVYYRVHVAEIGWMGWAKNGQSTGTTGFWRQIEALQVRLVRKGDPAPANDGATTDLFRTRTNKVYLDAGHGIGSSSPGVYDSGAAGSGYVEAEQTAELVRLVAGYARSLYGLNVYDNVGAGVNYRSRQADAASRDCSMFVSIHFNALDGSSATGTESYIHSLHAASGSDVLQQIMHRRLVGALGLTDRGMHQEQFAVCGGTVPATLLEVCFITNPFDMATYKAREDSVARALAAGLKEAADAGL